MADTSSYNLWIQSAAFHLVLRTMPAPFGKQILLNGIVKKIANLNAGFITIRPTLSREDLKTLWDLLEGLDRLDILEEDDYNELCCLLRRLDLRLT